MTETNGKPKVSEILPSLNVVAYIREALTSVMEQTHRLLLWDPEQIGSKVAHEHITVF